MPDPFDRRDPPTLGAARPGQGQVRRPAGQEAGGGRHPGYSPPPPPVPPGFRGPQTIYRREAAMEAEEPRSGSGVVGKALWGALGLVALLAVGAVFLLVNPPTSLIKDRLVSEVKSRTGRNLVISGDAHLSFLPSLGVVLNDVTLSAPPEMPGAPLLHADGLEVTVALLPLLTREVTVERLSLRSPVVELRVDSTGRRSWDFAEAEPLRQPHPVRYAQVNPRGPDGKPLPKDLQDFARNASDKLATKGAIPGINDLSLGDVRISDGTLRYTDGRKGVRYEMKGIDGRITLKDLAGPLEVSGRLVHAGEAVAFDGRVQSFKDALEERPTKTTLKVDAKPMQLSYDGLLAAVASSGADGRITIAAPSLDAAARFLGVPVSGLAPLGAVSVEGQVKVSGQSVQLSNARLALGETVAAGFLGVDTSGARPLVKTTLKIPALDLNRFAALEIVLAPAGATPAASAAPEQRPIAPLRPSSEAGRFSPPAGASIAGPRSIEDLINETGDVKPSPKAPQVRGFTRRDGWSSEPLNPALLRLVDVEARLDLGRLVWQALEIGQTQSAVQLKSGVLKLDVAQLDLYGGRAKLLLNLDAREPMMTVGANLSGDGVAMLPFLKGAADFDVIDGKGRIVVAVSAKGGSERELISSLAGKVDLRVADGALLGWDATQMMAGIGQGRLPRLERTADARTPFSELSGTFPIANGVARNQDLKLDSQSLRATGSGVINIVDRNLNLVVKPQPIAIGGLGAIEIPIRIAGPFDKVAVLPDLGGALGSQQLQGVAKQVGKQLKDGDVDGVLRGVLGNDPKADEKIDKAKSLLKQFLKQ